MRLFGSAFFSLAALIGLSGPAIAATNEPPPEVLADAKALMDEASPTQASEAPKSLFKFVDANGDGRKDWVVDFSKHQAGRYCGTGGCTLKIWVQDDAASPWRIELDRQTFRYSLPKKGVVRLQSHGTYCGGSGSDPCTLDFIWSANEKRFLEKPGADGQPIEIWSARPPRDAEIPQAIRNTRAAFAASCATKGGEPMVDDSITSIPDINGDGVRDWVFNGYTAYCGKLGDQIMPPCKDGYESEGECQLEVFAADPKTALGARLVYRGAVDWKIAIRKNGQNDLMVLPYDAPCGGPKQKACVFQKAALLR